MPKPEKTEKMLLIAAAVVASVAIVFVVVSLTDFFDSSSSQGDGDNLCKAPEGYTQEQWNEHMGHHPDQYKECLKK